MDAIVDLARILDPGVTVDDPANPKILRIERAGQPVEPLDIAFLAPLAGCRADIVIGLANAMARHATPNSRRAIVRDFRLGFAAYVSDTGLLPLRLSLVDKDWINKFVRWLDRPNEAGKRLSASYRSHRLCALKHVLLDSKALTPQQIAELMPRNAFSSEGVDEAKESRLTPEEFVSLKRSLDRWVTQIIRRAQSDIAALALHKRNKKAKGVPTHVRLAARLMDHYDGVIPEQQYLLADADLPNRYKRDLREEGARAVTSVYGPSAPDLTVLVFHLAIHSVYNQQPLLSLHLDDIEFSGIGGRVTLGPKKNRKRQRRVRRSFTPDDNDPTSPAVVLTTLLEWTKNIRAVAPEAIRGDLFLFVPKNRGDGRRVETLNIRDVKREGFFNSCVTNFCKSAGIPWVGLRTLRNCAEEFLSHHGASAELRAALLGHSIKTNARNYRTKRVRSDGEVQLAAAMSQRERYIRTEGKVDPRAQFAGRPPSAATPGFQCLDPLDSPVAGERPGTPCGAYAMCPACPLAQPDESRPYALRRLFDLGELFLAAFKALPRTTWESRYAASHLAIQKKWLPLLDNPDDRRRALALRVSPLPELE